MAHHSRRFRRPPGTGTGRPDGGSGAGQKRCGRIIASMPPSTNITAPCTKLAAGDCASLNDGVLTVEQAARLHAHLQSHPKPTLTEVAYSLATTRSAMEHRLALPAASMEALQALLDGAAQGQLPSSGLRGRVQAGGKIAFLFTGQGSQVVGMGRGLYGQWPAFRAAFDQCTALFDPHLPRPLREVMWAESGSETAALLEQTGYTQPALFTLEYALSQLWKSWGVQPDVVCGHSIGELVAACVAGVFSLEDAVRLVAARGRLMQALAAGGATWALMHWGILG